MYLSFLKHQHFCFYLYSLSTTISFKHKFPPTCDGDRERAAFEVAAWVCGGVHHVSVFHDKERSRALWGRNAGYTNGLGPADGSWAATEGDGPVDVAWPVEEGWSGAIRSWINRTLMNHNEAKISL